MDDAVVSRYVGIQSSAKPSCPSHEVAHQARILTSQTLQNLEIQHSATLFPAPVCRSGSAGSKPWRRHRLEEPPWHCSKAPDTRSHRAPRICSSARWPPAASKIGTETASRPPRQPPLIVERSAKLVKTPSPLSLADGEPGSAIQQESGWLTRRKKVKRSCDSSNGRETSTSSGRTLSTFLAKNAANSVAITSHKDVPGGI